MSTDVALAHLDRTAERIERAQSTDSVAERIGFAELAKGDIAAAIKETTADATSPGGKRKEAKGQGSMFTPNSEETHTVDEGGNVVDFHGKNDDPE